MTAPRTAGRHRRGARPEDRRLHRRVFWVAAALVCWSAFIAARLIDLQVIHREELTQRARMQHERTVVVPAHRGRILDRAGRPLAESIEVPSLYADIATLEDPSAAAAQLAPLLGRSRRGLARSLSSERSFVWLARRVQPATASAVQALKLDGIGSITESRRYYPAGRLAAHVLGIVGVDGDGLDGTEFRYNDTIGGRAGRMISVRDARGTSVLRYLERPSSSGQDLRLTLDSVIQYHAEVELDRAMNDTGSAWGSVIVMDPSTGAILAMANRPSFNPNAYGGSEPADRRNRAVTDLYEPGSTFKVVVAAAAIELGLVHSGSVIDCGHGAVKVAGRTIRDHKVFDYLRFSEVIAESSNVGAIRVGLRLSPEEFHRFTRGFGFGERAEVGLPGESRGLVRPPREWSGISQASLSIGQELSATPLQLLRAIAAIANGGVLPQPHIVEGAGRPGAGRRVVSERTARTVGRMLEGAVDHGTGKSAAVPGYRVAGKTGTAQKAEPGKGYGDRHVPSFAGYVPARSPALAILVVLDSPRGPYHGGEVAAPVFARVALPALRRLGIAPEVPVPHATSVRLAGTPDVVPPHPDAPSALLPRTGDGDPVVPDVAGASLRGALALLARAGLTARVEGTGLVVRQQPPAGTVLPAGSVVRVLLSGRTDGTGGRGTVRRGRARAG